MKPPLRPAIRGLAVLLAALLSPASAPGASFAPGSLVIPMDVTYQNSTMLRAYGLVFRLLEGGVPVQWAIAPGKSQGGVDFTGSGRNFQTGALVTNHGYRGGPFVIDAADRASAQPIIAAWHGGGNGTTVHDMTAAFTAEVARTLRSRPAIAVFADGNELIAFTALNAAGIRDELGQTWPPEDLSRVYPGFPDILNAAEIRGATGGGAPDGALVRADGSAEYCHLLTMHHTAALETEVSREVRLWLGTGPGTHLFAQCLSVTAFENAAHGRYLTTNGLANDGTAPSPVAFRAPDDPLAQLDGSFTAVTGSVSSLGLAVASTYRSPTRTLINGATAALGSRVVWLEGVMDGNPALGTVTYLTGHEYGTGMPVTSNPSANGVRLLLNSLLDSPCATTPAIGVARSETSGGLGLRAWPNPGSSGSRVAFELKAPARVTVAIHDLGGRSVRILRSAEMAAGRHLEAWDGRDHHGRPAPAGVYLIRVRAGGVHATTRVVVR